MNSAQVNAIHICLKGKNVQKVMFCWNVNITLCKYQKQIKKKQLKKTHTLK